MRALRPTAPAGLALLTALALTGCGRDADPSVAPEPAASLTSRTPSAAVISPPPRGVVPLPDGYVEPGRYRFLVVGDCEGAEKHELVECPPGTTEPPPIPLEVTVPAGWAASPEFHLLERVGPGTDPPGGAALVLGWTSNTVRVQSDPCLSKSHQFPDVRVGPGADDFVDAVVAQEWFPGKAPVDTRVGGAAGWYFTLEGPADLGECYEWRPWDPGFYAQGPSNIWDVWVLDVDGHRVLIVANYYPGTPVRTVDQLHRMVESIRFTTTDAGS